MKARDVISDWPKGPSTSRPYSPEVPMWRLWTDWSEVAERLIEWEDNKKYHDGQAAMMEEWRRTGGVKWPSQHIPYPRTSFKVEGFK